MKIKQQQKSTKSVEPFSSEVQFPIYLYINKACYGMSCNTFGVLFNIRFGTLHILFKHLSYAKLYRIYSYSGVIIKLIRLFLTK